MLSVLIAERELLVRTGMISCIPWNGMGLVLIGEAENGPDAWALYRQYHPDILVADLHTPGLDGLSLIRRVRSADPRCIVIAVTGDENADFREAAGRLNVNGFLNRDALTRERVSAVFRYACIGRDHGDGESADLMPEETAGITAVRLFPEEHLTPEVQCSLSAMLVHTLGPPEGYTLLSMDTCMLAVWKDASRRDRGENTLLTFARYVKSFFHVSLGILCVDGPFDSRRCGEAASRCAALLRDERLFDDLALRLDADGNYRDSRLDATRKALAISLFSSGRHRGSMEMKRLLDAYPGAMDRGFDRVAADAGPLLRQLGLDEPQAGLWELTGKICRRIWERLDRDTVGTRPEIRRVMAYIRAHLNEKLSREKLSALVNYDGAYLSRIFRAEVGMSLTDYLFRSRMLRAQELLCTTGDPVREIAERCGFCDPSYFCARFRVFCGLTPLEWRERHGAAT